MKGVLNEILNQSALHPGAQRQSRHNCSTRRALSWDTDRPQLHQCQREAAPRDWVGAFGRKGRSAATRSVIAGTYTTWATHRRRSVRERRREQAGGDAGSLYRREFVPPVCRPPGGRTSAEGVV
jgi:hypothetical protein